MNFYMRLFNLYLLLTVVLLAGCQSEKHKQSKLISALRVHVESKTDVVGDLGTTSTISLIRNAPVTVTVNRSPILSENDIGAAAVMATPGGFAVEVQFNSMGTLTLEQFTAANPGKHLVIFAQWGEKGSDGRWIAAPLITHRIVNGLLAFTPDLSREDSQRLVLGLNNVAKKNAKGEMK